MKKTRKSRFISLLLAILMVVGAMSLSSVSVSAATGDGWFGEGTWEEPYMVSTYDALRECLTKHENRYAVYITLAADIVCPDVNKSGYSLVTAAGDKINTSYIVDLRRWSIRREAGSTKDDCLFRVSDKTILTIFSSMENAGSVTFNSNKSDAAMFKVEGYGLYLGASKITSDPAYMSFKDDVKPKLDYYCRYGGHYQTNCTGIMANSKAGSMCIAIGADALFEANGSVISGMKGNNTHFYFVSLEDCRLKTTGTGTQDAVVRLTRENPESYEYWLYLTEDTVLERSTSGALIDAPELDLDTMLNNSIDWERCIVDGSLLTELPNDLVITGRKLEYARSNRRISFSVPTGSTAPVDPYFNDLYVNYDDSDIEPNSDIRFVGWDVSFAGHYVANRVYFSRYTNINIAEAIFNNFVPNGAPFLSADDSKEGVPVYFEEETNDLVLTADFWVSLSPAYYERIGTDPVTGQPIWGSKAIYGKTSRAYLDREYRIKGVGVQKMRLVSQTLSKDDMYFELTTNFPRHQSGVKHEWYLGVKASADNYWWIDATQYFNRSTYAGGNENDFGSNNTIHVAGVGAKLREAGLPDSTKIALFSMATICYQPPWNKIRLASTVGDTEFGHGFFETTLGELMSYPEAEPIHTITVRNKTDLNENGLMEPGKQLIDYRFELVPGKTDNAYVKSVSTQWKINNNDVPYYTTIGNHERYFATVTLTARGAYTFHPEHCYLHYGTDDKGNTLSRHASEISPDGKTAIFRLAHTQYWSDCNHTKSAEWTPDSFDHWHECTACKEKLDIAAHTWTDVTIDGMAYKQCSVCKYKTRIGTVSPLSYVYLNQYPFAYGDMIPLTLDGDLTYDAWGDCRIKTVEWYRSTDSTIGTKISAGGKFEEGYSYYAKVTFQLGNIRDAFEDYTKLLWFLRIADYGEYKEMQAKKFGEKEISADGMTVTQCFAVPFIERATINLTIPQMNAGDLVNDALRALIASYSDTVNNPADPGNMAYIYIYKEVPNGSNQMQGYAMWNNAEKKYVVVFDDGVRFEEGESYYFDITFVEPNHIVDRKTGISIENMHLLDSPDIIFLDTTGDGGCASTPRIKLPFTLKLRTISQVNLTLVPRVGQTLGEFTAALREQIKDEPYIIEFVEVGSSSDPDYIFTEGEKLIYMRIKPKTGCAFISELKDGRKYVAVNGEYTYCWSDMDDTIGIQPKIAVTNSHDLSNLNVIEAKAPTCTEAGNNKYYVCTHCGKAFKDASGNVATTPSNEVLAALGHSFSEKWKSNTDKHWHECKTCGEKTDLAAHTAPCEVCGYGKNKVIVGDVDGNNVVDVDDAIYTLYATMLPSLYPINQNGDFNGDGRFDVEDAIYLLMYTMLPDLYPLLS